MKTYRNAVLTVAAVLALCLTAGPSFAQSTGPQATPEQIANLKSMVGWADNLVDRMQKHGKTIAGAQTRELQAIHGQLSRFDRVVKNGASDAAGVSRRDVEELVDRFAQVWIDIRQSGENFDVADAAPAPKPTATGAMVAIPRGTNVTVELATWLSSKSANVGDRFSALLSAPVYVNGAIAIPSGAIMEGLVTKVDRAGRASDAGNLHIYIDRLRGPQGQIVDMRGLVVGLVSGDEIKGKGVSPGRTAAGAAIGGVLGGLLDGKKGALIGIGVGAGGTLLAEKGKDVDLPVGTQLRVEAQDGFSFAWAW